MSRLRRSRAWLWLLLPISAAVFYAGATLFYYPSSYSPPPSGKIAVDQIALPSYAPIAAPEAPVAREGLLIVDNAHGNDFSEEELSTLMSRVTSRGYSVEFLIRRDTVLRFGGGDVSLLKRQLRRADSFGVILPGVIYTSKEVEVVRGFLEKGGRLLLIGDPGRTNAINSLADSLGFLFQHGYLYNVVDHELNFRNIFVNDFRTDQVTEGLTSIVLFEAGAIRSTGVPLAFADTNTYSSMVERVEPFSPMAKTADGRVLAIGDFTFLRSPENATQDNDRLISNIADFLTTGNRSYDLGDFPHFFRADVEILLGNASIFDTGVRAKNMLSDAQIPSEIRGLEDFDKDTVFLGLYQDSLAVGQYLDIAGVQIGDSLRTPFTPDIATEGTALLLLHEGTNRRVLVVLADRPASLRSILGRLELGTFRSGLVGDLLGVYRVP